MRAKEFLSESLSKNDATPILKEFIKFVAKHLELDKLPTINLITGTDRAVKQSSFGGYGGHNINITISNRHIMDVCRTLAHELVHYRQDLNDQLNAESGNDGSPEENEANAQAAVIMRQWGKRHPELFGKESLE